jgi:hypothetical protein
VTLYSFQTSISSSGYVCEHCTIDDSGFRSPLSHNRKPAFILSWEVRSNKGTLLGGDNVPMARARRTCWSTTVQQRLEPSTMYTLYCTAGKGKCPLHTVDASSSVPLSVIQARRLWLQVSQMHGGCPTLSDGSGTLAQERSRPEVSEPHVPSWHRFPVSSTLFIILQQ